MNRKLAIALIVVLVFCLVFPASAFAKRGGVPANDKGKGAAVVQPSDDEAPDGDDAKGKDKKKDKGAVEEDPEGTDPGDGEESGEPEKLTGVANALSRLQRNLERMQADLEAGKRDGLPEGLQAAIAKFMSWLGIDPADEAETDDEGSSETSGTVEPEPADDADDVPADSPESPEVPVVE